MSSLTDANWLLYDMFAYVVEKALLKHIPDLSAPVVKMLSSQVLLDLVESDWWIEAPVWTGLEDDVHS